KVTNMIVDERANNSRILEPFMDQPQLNDTLAKHLISDSLGQHKNNKSRERLNAQNKATKLIESNNRKQAKTHEKSFLDEQLEYYSDKVDINEYLND
ncbi:hypothetical protein, partial [Bizionia algoritergicola]|uniref:hypothetical protein n=2 Tax=Bizionia TaxID=283785 RepID=UPI00147834A2